MAVMIARFLYHPFIKIVLLALLYATLVRASDKPVLCLLQATPDQYPMDESPRYWFFTYANQVLFDYAPYYLNDDVFNGKATSPDGFVVMKFYAPGAKYVPPIPDNDVHVYFYNGQGGGSRHIAFAYYAGYAYHFTSRNDFGGSYYDTATYSKLYITQGSCVEGEYMWPYKRNGKAIEFTSWLRNWSDTADDAPDESGLNS
ncbi:hypothetical protein V1523DRAFT_422412 [Lipomyces doorenjongii]